MEIPHTPDDAFITARYGYNLANGYGPTWNPGGAPVEGYSSFLWMVIHGLLSVFGDQQIIISKFLGGALTISWAYLMVQLGIYVGLKKFTASIAGLLFAAVPPVAFWGVSGMETPMLGIALTAAVLVLVRSEGISGRVLASILFGIAALVRHEAIVLLIGLGAAVFVVELAHTNLRNAARWGASIWLPGGVLYGLYFVWRVSYYGYLFPNPVYAKGGVSSAIISHPLLAISSLFPLLVVSLFAWERVFPNEFTSERSRRLAAGVIAGVSVVAIFTAAWFSPDTVATYFASDGKIAYLVSSIQSPPLNTRTEANSTCLR